MTARPELIAGFLARSDWADWQRSPLAGDASNRRYERLRDPATGDTVVLMDAPAERGEDVRPFTRLARHLLTCGLSAPEILAEDAESGLLVLEDFGDAQFARKIAQEPACEVELYDAAIDVLVALHRHPPPPDVPQYSPPFTADFVAPAYGWYVSGATGHLPAVADSFCEVLNAALLEHGAGTDVLMLRDYHAENLVWRPAHTGLARVGLLDFQDAMAGHRAYDLASLLTDARRDVSPALRDAMTERYLAATGLPPEPFRAACAVLGVQRNLRILGVFARLSLAFGKPGYVDLIPRVWGHLMHDLSHPALTNLRNIVLRDLPAPTDTHLKELKARCATVPMP
ncbi:aminoglycoside phosphotransferase family protein [Oceaniovalibus sp. ACAM 378]|uniref:aminoglycoside phosphotransferase family protein n=1 Tax=Oceaniovalibus sp. ACAM 378 TaxID=2599923 RepID=UPI0011D5C53B|nr:phosphotransferase [Oceaniovalibus sp. ACAM 378]TYB86449.1 phosphotransferase [Oceaniovalibus sp. ACAM 378]